MQTITYSWGAQDSSHRIELVQVEGTHGRPYSFAEGTATRAIDVPDFFIATVPVTQALWAHVMGANPSIQRGDRRPFENVSWDDITLADGFLDRINTSDVAEELARQLPSHATVRLRLPSETEWEYAARGGRHWHDRFQFSGFHNWAIHCTVSKRYEIAHDYRDGCIGFRLVLSIT